MRTDMRAVQRPNPQTSKPKLIAPPGACDTHLHVYGPSEIYPLNAERNYTPDPHSTLDDYLTVHRAWIGARGNRYRQRQRYNNQVTLDALHAWTENSKASRCSIRQSRIVNSNV